jgi:rhodanese-related sulfurtransferase
MFFRRRPEAATFSPQDAVRGAQDGSVTVIDVREHGEVAMSGKARGALHIPLMRLPHMADPAHPDFNPALRTDARIALYCASGARSGSAQELMRKLGYEDVHNIGGLSHWLRAGGQIDAA